MRLRGITRSRNIEDRRGRRGRRGGAVGGLGIGGILVVLVIGWLTGVDVMPLLSGGSAPATTSRPLSEADVREGELAARVLATTEAVWSREFPEQVGRPYTPPVMVLFSGTTSSPCGGASGATGPFYCPADNKAYLDTAFFDTMRDRLGAGGDFAAAYVIAHEVAHHVQNQLGVLGQVHQARQRAGQAEANALTVRSELMADCLSGIWARNVGDLMERGDLEEALNAARMIGDDHLQRQAGRVPQPHTFTHGTSEQRARWFERGYDSGYIRDCDTFAATRI
ncbi:neutral zinc metallopeptidase [Tateyamaria armeniaca]|uniref:Neutral zinc metallopeptidase n=1 Tax=Tateyamaria armeniaca TaxID=2518930 RepID=A0ABW8URR9_9RHOB